MSPSVAASTGEKIVIVLRDRKGRIKQVAGTHIPRLIRLQARIDEIKRKINPE